MQVTRTVVVDRTGDTAHTPRLEALESTTKELHSLLDVDATELDIVRKRVEQDLRDITTEVRMLGSEIAALKAAPLASLVARETAAERGVIVAGSVRPAQEFNVSAFGTNPMSQPPSFVRPSLVPPAHTPSVPVQPEVSETRLRALESLDPERKKLRVLVEVARAECGGSPVCCKCKWWDQDEGQQAIQQMPVFAQAARWVTPNRMGVPVLVNEEGDPLPQDMQPTPMLSAKLNKWELFGACMQDNTLHHAVDTCPSFLEVAA